MKNSNEHKNLYNGYFCVGMGSLSLLPTDRDLHFKIQTPKENMKNSFIGVGLAFQQVGKSIRKAYN